ncbi:MAG: PilZ domain-containing protein [Desulfosudaceae bacterium]
MSDIPIINNAIPDTPLADEDKRPDQTEQNTLSSSSRTMPLCTRRSHPRIYRKAHIRYSRQHSRHFHEAVMYNESGGGMYFETRTRLTPGTRIYIAFDEQLSLQLDPDKREDFFPAKVKWCIPVNHSTGVRYGVGVQYYRPILH